MDSITILWGDRWRERIDDALIGTTFFIPVVTASYLKSEECRREILSFSGHARRLGLTDLVLPIIYSPVPALADPNPTDEVVALIRQRQYEDWTTLRLAGPQSSPYREGVNRLASRLIDIAGELASSPTTLPEDVAPPPHGTVVVRGPSELGGEGAESEFGLIDAAAFTETTIGEWALIVGEIAEVIERLGEVASSHQHRLEMLTRSNAPFSARIKALRAVARDLEPAAGRLETLGQHYASKAVQLDPAVLTLLSYYDTTAGQASAHDVEEAFGGLRTLGQASREGVGSLRELLDSMEPMGALSRDLRGPLARARSGLMSIIDAQGVIDAWESRVDQLTGAVAASALLDSPSPEGQ